MEKNVAPLLLLKNLRVFWPKKGTILQVDSWQIEAGRVYALLGPNASGKSTLAKVIAGLGGYRVSGEIIFQGKKINNWPPEKRVKKGIALAFQSPPSLRGILLGDFLRQINPSLVNSSLALSKELLAREVNVGFSGGEKKMSEVEQIITLRPKLAIFDEIDSGLDMKNVRRIASLIKEHLLKKNTSLILITHQGEILRHLPPDRVDILFKGRFICHSSSWRKVWRTVREYGYQKCRQCYEESQKS